MNENNTIKQIARENRERWEGCPLVAIVEIDGKYEVHRHGPEGVSPTTAYPTKRKAVARMLQLLRVGPIAPQMHPEEAYIGKISII